MQLIKEHSRISSEEPGSKNLVGENAEISHVLNQPAHIEIDTLFFVQHRSRQASVAGTRTKLDHFFWFRDLI